MASDQWPVVSIEELGFRWPLFTEHWSLVLAAALEQDCELETGIWREQFRYFAQAFGEG